MRLTDKEKTTVQYYELHGEEWSSRMCYSQSFWTREIDYFHKLLPSGKILEIGSGSGRDAMKLIQLGYDYIGTDVSKKLLKIAKKNNPEAKFFHQSVYDLNFPKATFDGFWTCATLLHVPKSKIDEALKSIQSVVKTKGIGFITLKEGKGESIEKQTGRYFFYYTKQEFIRHLQTVNFSVIKTNKKTHKKTNTTWLIFFVRKDD